MNRLIAEQGVQIVPVAVIALLIMVISLTVAWCGEESMTVERVTAAEKAVLNRLTEIQSAAELLDANKVFSYVADNDKGALVQNGRVLLTRNDAMEATKRAFANYQIDTQHVTMLSPSAALVIGEGTATVETKGELSRSRRFAQSVVLVLRDGEWKVLHTHRSYPVE